MFVPGCATCIRYILPALLMLICEHSFVQSISLCCLLRQISWMGAKSQNRITSNWACSLCHAACKYGRVRLGHRGETLHLPRRKWSRPRHMSGSERLLTSEVRAKSQSSSYGICGGQNYRWALPIFVATFHFIDVPFCNVRTQIPVIHKRMVRF
jgi:hypothetical protein